MKQLRVLALLCLTLALFVGCGSGGTKPVAEQDEITKWVADNPAPEAVEVSPQADE